MVRSNEMSASMWSSNSNELQVDIGKKVSIGILVPSIRYVLFLCWPNSINCFDHVEKGDIQRTDFLMGTVLDWQPREDHTCSIRDGEKPSKMPHAEFR